MDARELEASYSGLKEALEKTPSETAKEITDLTNKCSAALNQMSDGFIQFSLAYVKLKRYLEDHDHPTLFDDKDKT